MLLACLAAWASGAKPCFVKAFAVASAAAAIFSSATSAASLTRRTASTPALCIHFFPSVTSPASSFCNFFFISS